MCKERFTQLSTQYCLLTKQVLCEIRNWNFFRLLAHSQSIYFALSTFFKDKRMSNSSLVINRQVMQKNMHTKIALINSCLLFHTVFSIDFSSSFLWEPRHLWKVFLGPIMFAYLIIDCCHRQDSHHGSYLNLIINLRCAMYALNGNLF